MKLNLSTAFRKRQDSVPKAILLDETCKNGQMFYANLSELLFLKQKHVYLGANVHYELMQKLRGSA